MRPACPRCLATIGPGVDAFDCEGCGATYRGLLGIPDLRVAEDEFLANDDDWAYAKRLCLEFDRLDLRGLLDLYYDLSPSIPDDLRRRQIGHILGGADRSRRWLDVIGPIDPAGPILDLGCGSGTFLAAVAGQGRPLLGVDIAMRWLVIARKRLDEAGHAGVDLACGCAERLPVAPSCLAAVVGGDVIEHVADIARTLAEAHRVLRPGGVLFLATPNRFSLAPEPHVGIWGVGYLPRRLMGAYVAWRRELDFRAIHTLGYGGWRRMLADSPFRGGDILVPGLDHVELASSGGVKRRLGLLYNRLLVGRLGRLAGRRVGPMFHLIGRR